MANFFAWLIIGFAVYGFYDFCRWLRNVIRSRKIKFKERRETIIEDFREAQEQQDSTVF